MPLFSAIIIQAAGWRWVFWRVQRTDSICLELTTCRAIAITATLGGLLMFFLLPESYWDRTATHYHHRHSNMQSMAMGKDKGSVEMIETIAGKDIGVKGQLVEENTIGDFKGAEKMETITALPPFTEATLPSIGDTMPELKRNYTHHWRAEPPKSFKDQLEIFPGKLHNGNWFLIATRPFILYAYPSILWAALVYSLSVGWLIVISESVSEIYRNRYDYQFTSLEAGLVYISPFIGAVLGTAVAGKISDFIVKAMARRNDGVYEPEFRLVMAFPVAITTTAGLMGFGWSAQVHDAWIVPTVFFGIISFGCSLGSTVAISFAVDSYKEYSAESLVTLNFSKSRFSCLGMAIQTLTKCRYFPWPCVFAIFPSLARGRGSQASVYCYRMHPNRLHAFHNSDVFVRQTCAWMVSLCLFLRCVQSLTPSRTFRKDLMRKYT
jgi:hypothetical protein